jgi:hypothetical protein
MTNIVYAALKTDGKGLIGITKTILIQKLVYKIIRQHRLNERKLSTERTTSYNISDLFFKPCFN